MSLATKQQYGLDLILQGLFYIPMMLCYTFALVDNSTAILGLLIQFFVGVIQVLSGAIHSIRYKDSLRQRYFYLAIGYVAFLILASALNFIYYNVFLMVLFVIVIPVAIATWYFVKTKNDYTKFVDTTTTRLYHEDVLDDVLL